MTTIQQRYENPIVLYVKLTDMKDPFNVLQFESNRASDKYEKPSAEMTRVADIIGKM